MGKGKVQPALRNISRHNGLDTHERGHFCGTLMFEITFILSHHVEILDSIPTMSGLKFI